MSFYRIPRFRLATLPTPLHRLDRLSEALGGPAIWIKRDDLTGLAFGGNKTRKLEYLVADAQAKAATHLVTEGGVQSNHVRQTAAAARLAGMHAVLVLNSHDPAPAVQGNLLIDELLGAAWHTVPTGADRPAKMRELAEALAAAGHTPYLIPTGGSNAVGALGYAAAVLELNEQLWSRGVSPTRLYSGACSGGTHAGLVLGQALFGADYPITAVLADGSADQGRADALSIAGAAADRFGLPVTLEPRRVACDDTQVGEGYGVPTEACLEAIRLLAQHEAILLDPVYSGKAMAGLIADVRAGRYGPTDTLLFIHTGGNPALFAKVDDLRPILPGPAGA